MEQAEGESLPASTRSAGQACAEEFYIGEPIVKNGMHLDADAHVTKDGAHGFAEDAWMPYLTVSSTIEKIGSSFRSSSWR